MKSYVLLAEITPYDPVTTSTVTVRMASARRDTRAVNVPGNANQWLPAITQAPQFSYAIIEEGVTGEIETTYGSIGIRFSAALDNDTWSRYVWDGALTKLWIGELGADFSTYSQIFQGRAGSLERGTRGTGSISLRGAEADLDKPLLSATYAGTGNAEGPLELKGKAKPWTSGLCEGVEAVLIDPVNWVYQYHAYGPTQGVVAVYGMALDLGAATAVTSGYAGLVGLTLAPGQWAYAADVGMFRLGAEPSGKITADVAGALDGATFPVKVGAIASHLIKTAGVAAGSISSTSATALDTDFPHDWNLYVADGTTTIAEAVRKACSDINGYAFADGSGVWRFGRFKTGKTPTVLADSRTSTPLVRAETVTQLSVAAPVYEVKVGGRRNYGVHTTDEISPALLDALEKLGGIAEGATRNVVTRSATEPTSPVDGDIWVDTSVTPPVTRVRISGSWQVGGTSVFQGTDIGVANGATSNVTTYSATAPLNPENGWIWVDTSTVPAIVKVYANGTWINAEGADWAASVRNIPPFLTDGRITLALNADGTIANGKVLGDSIAAAVLDDTKFMEGYEPVGSGPTLPNPDGYTGPNTFFNTTDRKLYRYDPTGGSSGGGDEHWTSVVLLAGFTGNEGSTTITDESSVARSFTTVGDAQLDTAISKFGGSSLLLDGTGDYVTTADSNDFEFGTGSFTIEGWAYPLSTNINPRFLIARTHPSANQSSWAFEWTHGEPALNFRWWPTASGSSSRLQAYTHTLTTNVWTHLAVDYDAATTTLRIYKNGTMVAKQVIALSIANSTATCVIGSNSQGGSLYHGHLDEWRVTKGVARYNSDSGFAVATQAFPRNGATTTGAWISAVDEFTGTITADQILDGSISGTKFASSIKPVEIVSTLPTTDLVEGRIVYLTTDNKLYRYDGSAWTSSLATSDLTGFIQANQIAANSITAGQIAAGAIATEELAASAITAEKIAALTITGDKIAANTIAGSKIMSDTIETGHLKAGIITADKIQANTITGDRLAANTITSAYLATSNLITASAQIADGIVTNLKVGDLQSSNYVAGVSGWKIFKNGDTELNGVIISRDLILGSGTYATGLKTGSGAAGLAPAEWQTFYIPTSIPNSAWVSSKGPLVAVAGFGAPSTVYAHSVADEPNTIWGLVTEVIPATPFSGTPTIWLKVRVWGQYHSFDATIYWTVYDVT